MKKKQIAVFGLGIFGSTTAKYLAEHDYEVMAVDVDREATERLEDIVTHAVIADATDIEALEALGIEEFDVAIVAMGSKLEASILSILNLKELGIPYVIAKTKNKTHKLVLEKIGADEVILPEKEMGIRLARRLMSHNILDSLHISDSYTILEMKAPKNWIGKTLNELNLRERYGINLVAVHERCKADLTPCDRFSVSFSADYTILQDSVLVVIAENNAIEKLDYEGRL